MDRNALISQNVAMECIQERLRQVNAEGFTPQHDDAHVGGSIGIAASCYLRAACDNSYAAAHPAGKPPLNWPWDAKWWKPKDRRANLRRAAALTLAEMERLDRMAANLRNRG